MNKLLAVPSVFPACIAFLLLFLLLAGSGRGQTPGMVPPVTDPRSAAMGGASGGDGDFFDSLWRSPGLLGAMNHNLAVFQRGSENEKSGGYWTHDQLGLRRSSRYTSLAFGFRESRFSADALVDSLGRPVLDRRLAFGLGRTLDEKGVFGIGLMGTATFLDQGDDQLFGYGLGLGFHYSPTPDIVFGPSALVVRGDRFENRVIGDRFAWTLNGAACLLDSTLLVSAEYGELVPEGGKLRLGAEVDFLRRFFPEIQLPSLQRALVRLGINAEGLTYGIGWEFSDFRLDLGSGLDQDGRFSTWSIAHVWGVPQRKARRREVDRQARMREMEEKAEIHRARGEYQQAASLYDELALQPETADRQAKADECRTYQQMLETADERYFSVETFTKLGDDYRKLAEFSPQFERASRRQNIVDMVRRARKLIAGARGSSKTEDLAQGRKILDEIRSMEPGLPIADAILFKEYDLLQLRLELDDVYPAMYRHYAKHPLGQLIVTNGYPVQIDELRLKFRILGLMPDRELETVRGMAPGASLTVPLYADFIESAVLNPALDMHRPAEIQATLATPHFSVDRSHSTSVRFYDHNHINWNNPLSLTAFVNPTSKSLHRLMVQVNDLTPAPYADQLPARSQGIFASILTFNLCKQLNLKYQLDPESMVGDPDRPLDVVNRPEQTLAEGAGDCDDLTVLWASMLMSRGVAATGVLLPDHIMLLVDTGIPAERWEDALLPRDLLIIREGRVWLPLEPTTEVGSYLSMVRYASQVLNEVPEAQRRYIPFSTASVDFPPAGIDRGEVQRNIEAANLRMAIESDIFDLGNNRQRKRQDWLEGRLDTQDTPGCAEMLDRAVALAVIGEFFAADSLLIEAASCEDLQPEILNNRGAIALKRGDFLGAQAFFQQALERDPQDRGARVNLYLARLLESTEEPAAGGEDPLAEMQDLVATVGVEPLTALLGGVNPNLMEKGRIHGTTSASKVNRLVDETLGTMEKDAQAAARLRERWRKVGYREDEPPVVFRRSGGYAEFEQEKIDRDVRHTNIEFPEKIQVGVWENLTVQIVDPVLYDDSGRAIGIWELLTNEAAVELPGVSESSQRVYCRITGEGFVIQGEDRHFLTVPTTGHSNLVEIPLQAAEPGPLDIKIKFYQNGRPLGTVTRTAIAIEDEISGSGRQVRTRANIGSNGQGPDLMVEIESELLAAGNVRYNFRLHSPANKLNLAGDLVGKMTTNIPPDAWLSSQYQTLESLKDDYMAQNSGELDDHMISLGRMIFQDLLPPRLQQILREGADLQTIVFKSDESLIPWELAYYSLAEEDSGNARHLAERCQVSRWTGDLSMPMDLNIDRALLVAVRSNPTDQPIPQGARTLAILQGIQAGGLGVTNVDPSYEEMAGYLTDEQIGLYHFECHGDFKEGGDLSTLHLRTGRLRAQYLNNPNYQLSRARPMIFLDACHAGRSGLSIASAGGWAHEAMTAGASVFIAPLWEVDTRAAGIFAAQLYEELNSGATLGEAVAAARDRVRTEDETYTWLAYSVYGDPNARLQTPIN